MDTSVIMHVDMDAFFASVEQLDRPEWRGKPLVVGRSGGRGVVSAASYEARKYGIRSAMPMFEALRRCPHVIVAPGRRARYSEISCRIMEVLSGFSPVVEPVSVDEAFVDISGTGRLFGPPSRVGEMVKEKVRAETGLACSVGIAPVRFLAKIASDMNKPDGLTVVGAGDMESLLVSLPVGKVSGVGGKTLAVLDRLGLKTMGDIRRAPEGLLERHLGRAGGRLRELAWGRDDTGVGEHAPVKSVSAETTLDADERDMAVLRMHLMQQAERIARELRHKGKKGRTVTVKIKWADFQQITRSRSFPGPVRTSLEIFRAAEALLAAEPLKTAVRLIGVGVSQLVDEDQPVQAALFGPESARSSAWHDAECAMDSVRQRFGGRSVGRAVFLEPYDSD